MIEFTIFSHFFTERHRLVVDVEIGIARMETSDTQHTHWVFLEGFLANVTNQSVLDILLTTKRINDMVGIVHGHCVHG
jgi:hypothetical protein